MSHDCHRFVPWDNNKAVDCHHMQCTCMVTLKWHHEGCLSQPPKILAGMVFPIVGLHVFTKLDLQKHSVLLEICNAPPCECRGWNGLLLMLAQQMYSLSCSSCAVGTDTPIMLCSDSHSHHILCLKLCHFHNKCGPHIRVHVASYCCCIECGAKVELQ